MASVAIVVAAADDVVVDVVVFAVVAAIDVVDVVVVIIVVIDVIIGVFDCNCYLRHGSGEHFLRPVIILAILIGLGLLDPNRHILESYILLCQLDCNQPFSDSMTEAL